MSSLIDRVDVRAELENFEWRRATWSTDKLIACSPFRDESAPSFYVWLDGESKGFFKDSGAYDPTYEKGGFLKLLAFLRDESIDSTKAYLEEVYGDGTYREGDKITIPEIIVTPPRIRRFIPEIYLDNFVENYDYLLGRGISVETQKLFGIRLDERHGSVVMPWRYPDGSIGNIKYRNTAEKQFYYEKGAVPIRELLFGIDQVHRVKAKKVAITEAEIDAMSLWEVGVATVAVGTSSISDEQAAMLLKTDAVEFVSAGDNDEQGEKLAQQIRDRLGLYMPVKRYNFAPFKDANEVLQNRRGLIK